MTHSSTPLHSNRWPHRTLRLSLAISVAAFSTMVPASEHGTAPTPTPAKIFNLEVAAGVTALCEPSAALPSPWKTDEILIADNENKKLLYVFSVDGNSTKFQRTLEMPQDNKPKDIEALANTPDGVLLVGSHSRKSSCLEDSKRQRLRTVTLGADGKLLETAHVDSGTAWTEATKDAESCVAALFAAPAPEQAKAVCNALVNAETQSTTGSCNTLNVEGAVTDGTGNTWLGLRAPLVNGQAAMLRIQSDAIAKGKLLFDQVALLDLDGFGIRELAAIPGDMDLWGIAGPELDKSEPFKLWSMPFAELSKACTLKPTLSPKSLETSSEGIVILPNRILILIDGNAGAAHENDETKCVTKGRGYFVTKPTD